MKRGLEHLPLVLGGSEILSRVCVCVCRRVLLLFSLLMTLLFVGRRSAERSYGLSADERIWKCENVLLLSACCLLFEIVDTVRAESWRVYFWAEI